MLGHTGVAHYGRRCSWAHSEGHIGVAHYGILVGGPLQLRWQPIGRRCLWAHLGEVPTLAEAKGQPNRFASGGTQLHQNILHDTKRDLFSHYQITQQYCRKLRKFDKEGEVVRIE